MGYSGIDTLLTTLYSFIKKIHLLSQKKTTQIRIKLMDAHLNIYISFTNILGMKKKKQKQKDLITFPPGKLILE